MVLSGRSQVAMLMRLACSHLTLVVSAASSDADDIASSGTTCNAFRPPLPLPAALEDAEMELPVGSGLLRAPLVASRPLSSLRLIVQLFKGHPETVLERRFFGVAPAQRNKWPPRNCISGKSNRALW